MKHNKLLQQTLTKKLRSAVNHYELFLDKPSLSLASILVETLKKWHDKFGDVNID